MTEELHANSPSPAEIRHDAKLIEASFHSGIAPKGEVEELFKKYAKK